MEASLQEAFLETFHDLLTSRAAAAGATGTPLNLTPADR